MYREVKRGNCIVIFCCAGRLNGKLVEVDWELEEQKDKGDLKRSCAESETNATRASATIYVCISKISKILADTFFKMLN